MIVGLPKSKNRTNAGTVRENERMANYAFWFGLIGAVVALFPTVRWMARKVKKRKESNIDEEIIAALGNPAQWKGPRPTTGAGYPAVDADELAEALSVKKEVVLQRLQALEAAGRVKRGAESFSHPAPRWWVVPQ